MKIKLLNSGNYLGLADINFPVIVSATKCGSSKKLCNVSALTLLFHGADEKLIGINETDFPFVFGKHCEIISEVTE